MQRNRGTALGALAAIGVVLALTLSVPALAAPVAGSGTPNPTAPPEQWAYGAVYYRNASAELSLGDYSVAAFFGWNVVFTLTNTSNTSFELEAQRTMTLRYSASLCAPDCANPRTTFAVTIRALDRETGFANYSTTSSVSENGTGVAALGIVNSATTGQSYLNESLAENHTIGSTTESYESALQVAARTAMQASFNGSLGLIPWNLAPGLEWTSTAGFTATGSYANQYTWQITGNNGSGPVSLSGRGGPSGAVNASGVVALSGGDLGNFTLNNGQTTPVVVIVWTRGPFDGLDGIILVPRAYEIFGTGVQVWNAHSFGLVSVATSRMDLALDVASHRVRFAAAASTYAGSDSLAATAGAGGSADAATPAASTGVGSSLVQAQPESVPAAQAAASCFASPTCSLSGPSASRAPSDLLLPALIAGVAVAVVVGAVGTIEYRRLARRREERRLQSGYLRGGLVDGAPSMPYPSAPRAPPVAPATPPETPQSPPGSPPNL